MLIAFPMQQWLHERASMLRYTYTACFVTQIGCRPGEHVTFVALSKFDKTF